jgi:hypothetical protein
MTDTEFILEKKENHPGLLHGPDMLAQRKASIWVTVESAAVGKAFSQDIGKEEKLANVSQS